ncbi:ATP-binding protein [Fuerstiella marisgermanici]|uniref:2-oxoacid:acceptor oxidoreductase, delta subunit, pyruvate/2-ketoisovalerate family n=1 Tax=Fuerstiella marisgermanici TaxID=1891926 RepID=A0A1P8W999_9PLAN|nr:ferredoxin family protein [Fuerstiella marisgermanici]APZ90609.1 2-oxoacid:acceptor oxidoreductase, delta subunit, pyruvate/2-ketoisovalerate family [Fuerstiella marisgermanici]
MAATKITVVICQAQGRNPVKRQLEEDILTALIAEPGVDASLVPHLYDMSADHTGMLFLKSVPGPLVVLGWLYERATQWTLDRAGVRGHEGISLIRSERDEDEDLDDEETHAPRGIGTVDVPDRNIYCMDLRVRPNAADYIEEIRRIVGQNSVQTVDLMSFINGNPKADQLQRYLNPERQLEARKAFDSGAANTADKESLPEDTRRRWYPVIDYSRCTNCMECIDFCLFGVYGVDALDRILVEEQDNCKKGCPACSRVCPENAIIFPQHKTPAIAGADGEVGGIKIDLSKLFGGDDGTSALDMAVKERDQELILDGRNAVGMSVGIKQRDRDEMDQLMDELEALEF